MASDPHWFHAASFARLGAFAIGRGVAPADLFRKSGVSPLQFLDAEELIPRVDALRLINGLAEMLGDPTASLRLVHQQQIHDYGVVGEHVLQAPTFKQALGMLTRGIQLVQSGTQIGIETTARHVRLTPLSIGHSGEDATLHMEAATAWLYRAACLAGVPDAVEVGIAASRPRRSDDYEQVLGARLRFGSERNEVIFDRALLQMPLAMATPALEVPAGAARLTIDPVENSRTVMRAILTMMPRSRPTVDRIAVGFGVSTRTLQRILERSGLSFEAVVDEARRRRARELLELSHSTLEIAFMLGYSDPAHFSRAFRRWTGTTPGLWRRNRRAGVLVAAE